MKLKQRTKAQIKFTDEDWDVSDEEWAGELEDAIETVREDHDAQPIIDPGKQYLLTVRWNEPTDSVWVGVWGYSLGLEVDDNNPDADPLGDE